MKNFFIFFENQIKQIHQGGLRLFFLKLKVGIKKLWILLMAPVVSYLNLDWPEVQDFLISQRFVKTAEHRLLSNPDVQLIDALQEKSIRYLRKKIQSDPDISSFNEWMQRGITLENLYLTVNRRADYMYVRERIYNVQSDLLKKHQLDVLDLEFIPQTVAIGSFGLYDSLEIYLKARILEQSKKKFVLLLKSNLTVNNPCYLNYWQRYIQVIRDDAAIEALSPLAACLTTDLVSFLRFDDKLCTSYLALGEIRQKWIDQGFSPILQLTSEDKKRGQDCLQSMGLPAGAWFVILHAREPGWRDGGTKQEDFRNVDVTTYFPAIKRITDRGGWVIRIGDKSMTKLPVMPQVIDYAHSQFKSDWMDVFLCAQCRFFIGTASGMCVIPSAFGVPLVMTNLLPSYGAYHFTSLDLFIPRLFLSTDNEEYIGFGKILSPPISTGCSVINYNKLKLRIVKNEAEEITEVVQEMLERCEGTLKYNPQDEELQKKYRKVAVEAGKSYGELDLSVRSRIGRHFLNKYARLLTD